MISTVFSNTNYIALFKIYKQLLFVLEGDLSSILLKQTNNMLFILYKIKKIYISKLR